MAPVSAASTCTFIFSRNCSTTWSMILRARTRVSGLSRSLCVSSVLTSSWLGSIFSRRSGCSSSSEMPRRCTSSRSSTSLTCRGKSSVTASTHSGIVSCGPSWPALRSPPRAPAPPLAPPPAAPWPLPPPSPSPNRNPTSCSMRAHSESPWQVIEQLSAHWPRTSRQRASTWASVWGIPDKSQLPLFHDMRHPRVDRRHAGCRRHRSFEFREFLRLDEPVPLGDFVGQRLPLPSRESLAGPAQPGKHRQKGLPLGGPQKLVDPLHQRRGAQQNRSVRDGENSVQKVA